MPMTCKLSELCYSVRFQYQLIHIWSDCNCIKSFHSVLKQLQICLRKLVCIPECIYIYVETQHSHAVVVWKAAVMMVTKTWYLKVNIKHLNWKWGFFLKNLASCIMIFLVFTKVYRRWQPESIFEH